jgi:hypothetical protein
VSHRIDLVQGQISAHQAKVGSEESYPDIYDIDNDGNTNEVVHVKHLKEQEEPEEEYAFRRGR